MSFSKPTPHKSTNKLSDKEFEKVQQKLFDKLKIDGKTYYAYGEYAGNMRGYKFAKKDATRIRAMGFPARIIKRKSAWQVYSTSKHAIMSYPIN